MTTARTVVILLGAAALALCGGCITVVTPPAVPAADDTASTRADVADQQVAFDFANAIMQLLGPETAPLRFGRESEDEDSVIEALREMLVTAGYAVRRADEERGGDGGDRLVSHAVVVLERDGGSAERHEVAVGEVRLRRAYRDTGDGKVLPVSALFVKGADAGSIRMVDEVLFGVEADDAAPLEDEGFVPATIPSELLASYEHLLADGSPAGVRRVSVEAPATAPAGAPAQTLAGLPEGARTENVRELGRSNYAAMLDGLNVVVEHVVEFDGGSDRLDQGDVALIDDVLERFDIVTDVISVVGYSTGGSTDDDALNRGLALRRADRVRRALTAVGVPPERVLVEAYWSATDTSDDVPSRGAVLSLQRSPT